MVNYDREKHSNITLVYNPRELSVNVALGGILTSIVLKVSEKMELYLLDVLYILCCLGAVKNPDTEITGVITSKVSLQANSASVGYQNINV